MDRLALIVLLTQLSSFYATSVSQTCSGRGNANPEYQGQGVWWSDVDHISGKRYRRFFSDLNYNYTKCQAYCWLVGGMLPEPRNQQENDFLAMVSRDGFWLGMTYSNETDQWVWESDGTNVTWTNWNERVNFPGQLSGDPGKDCAIMIKYFWRRHNISYDFKTWTDQRCSDNVSEHFCEKAECRSEACVNLSEELRANMNDSADPCDNFYEYACGRWDERNRPSEGLKNSWFHNINHRMKNKVNDIIKEILGKPISPNDADYVKKAKLFYTQCMDNDTINNLGIQPLRDLIDEYGGWPLLSPDWDSASYSLGDQLLKLNKYKIEPMFDLNLHYEPGESQSKLRLRMEATLQNRDLRHFDLPIDYYFSRGPREGRKYIEWLSELVLGIAKLMGAEDNNATRGDIAEMITFSFWIGQKYIINNQQCFSQNDSSQNLTYINENYSVPNLLNMTDYISRLVELGENQITEDEIIMNECPSYFTDLKKVLKFTSAKAISNYVVWKGIVPFLETLGDNVQGLIRTYNSKFQKTQESRADICTRLTNEHFKPVVGKMFIDAKFLPAKKQMAEEIASNVRCALNNHLNDLDWLDDVTRYYAKEKNNYMIHSIGYEDKDVNGTLLNQTYANVYFENSGFLLNFRKIKHKMMVSSFEMLRTTRNRNDIRDPPQDVAAAHLSDRNKIVLMGGYLQPTLFHEDYPKYINYGRIGQILGHEIIHGFDTQGRHRDRVGRLFDWWNEETASLYENKSQCFLNQTAEYSVNVNGTEYHLRPSMTLGETISDNGGLVIAWQAYQNWLEDTRSSIAIEEGLPRLDFTSEKLFFISYAQTWCEIRDDENLKNIASLRHPPSEFRVNNAVKNHPHFGDVFYCRKGTNMNPVEKCKVW